MASGLAPDPTGSQPRRPIGASLLVGLLVFVLTLAAGLGIALVREHRWSASASDIVLPSPRLDAATSAGFYETLSRGQIVATVAEMLRLPAFQTSAADRLRLSAAQRASVKVTVDAVPETALVRVSVSAPTPALAGRMADAVLDEANRQIASGRSGGSAPAPPQAAGRPAGSSLLSPYTVTRISSARGNEVRVGIGTLQFGVIALLVALVAGFMAQQASEQLAQLLAARRGSRAQQERWDDFAAGADSEPDGTDAPVDDDVPVIAPARRDSAAQRDVPPPGSLLAEDRDGAAVTAREPVAPARRAPFSRPRL